MEQPFRRKDPLGSMKLFGRQSSTPHNLRLHEFPFAFFHHLEVLQKEVVECMNHFYGSTEVF